MIFRIYFVLIFLAYLVPFTLLARVNRFWGSFLFWMVFALVALALLLRMMSTWNHEH
ncbi:MAG: hypothetical protein ACP5Q4_02465 [Candidatus Caldatribacteriaceae bacterium]